MPMYVATVGTGGDREAPCSDLVTTVRDLTSIKCEKCKMHTPTARSRVCTWLTLALLAGMAGTAATGCTALVRTLTCTATQVQREQSPDGAYVASLYRLNCGGAMNHYEGAVFLSDRAQTVNPLEFETASGTLYPFVADTTI